MTDVNHEIVIRAFNSFDPIEKMDAVGIRCMECVSIRDTKKYGFVIYTTPVQESNIMLSLIPVYPNHQYARWFIWAPNSPRKRL